jgi:hypothetical protein
VNFTHGSEFYEIHFFDLSALFLFKMPNPFGALNPRLCLIIRFMEARAAILFVKEGIRNPNFIALVKFIF